MSDFQTLRYEARDRKAYITLSRPERVNSIDDRMPCEIRAAVERAENDPDVHVIVLSGDGDPFCTGYDLKKFAEDGNSRWSQDGPSWDPVQDYLGMRRNTDDFFTLFRSLKAVLHSVSAMRRALVREGMRGCKC